MRTKQLYAGFNFIVDGEDVKKGEMRAKDASVFLNSLDNLISETSFIINGDTPLDLRIHTTKKGSFEFLLEIIQIAVKTNQLNLTENVQASIIVAQNLGLISNNGLTNLIELVKFLKGKPIKTDSISIDKNKNSIIANGNNNILKTNNITINLYNTPEVRKALSDLVQPLLENPGYDKISFKDEARLTETSHISKEDAEYFSYKDDEEQEIESIIQTQIKVIKPVFEGKSQWSIKYENQTVNARIADEIWLQKFQTNQVDLPPRSIVNVTIKKTSYFTGDRVSKSPKYEIIEIHKITRPPTQTHLI